MCEVTLDQEIKDAEMILVGLGEEFDGAFVGMAPEEEELVQTVKTVLAAEDVAWAIPMLMEMQNEVRREKIKKGLTNLAKKLEGKNYFVITESQECVMEEIPWREGRLVMPCGSVKKKQCSVCHEEMPPQVLTEGEWQELMKAALDFWQSVTAEGLKQERQDAGKKESGTKNAGFSLDALPEEVRRAMLEIARREKIKDAAKSFRKRAIDVLGECEQCGEEMTLNVLQAPKYDQRGYLDQWGKYVKWLGGSTNRKLLLLEIGTEEDRQELIREPFEKVSELNLKSKHVIVSMGEARENDKKAVQIKKHVIDWLENL